MHIFQQHLTEMYVSTQLFRPRDRGTKQLIDKTTAGPPCLYMDSEIFLENYVRSRLDRWRAEQ